MWGTPTPRLLVVQRQRFIPTHVGNTHLSSKDPSRPTVHPHACGEHIKDFFRPTLADGSSPRMWGTLLRLRLCLCSQRFIPTHVGNTFRQVFLPVSRSVHPHACGEHYPVVISRTFICGSSPRMWGTRRGKPGRVGVSRFIPTHVGNTLPLTSQIYIKYWQQEILPNY